jgi:hypothetical protein
MSNDRRQYCVRGRFDSMADIIAFPGPVPRDEDPMPDVDLLTALDVAIRDLYDIAQRTSGETRRQAEACRELLERTYAMACRMA